MVGVGSQGHASVAGKAVGAPFAGAVAACLAISELLRLLHQGPVHQVIDIDLASVEHRSLVLNQNDFSTLNPGFIAMQAAQISLQ